MITIVVNIMPQAWKCSPIKPSLPLWCLGFLRSASPFSFTKFCLTSNFLGDSLLSLPTGGALFCYMASHLWLSFSGRIQWLRGPCLWILHHGCSYPWRNVALKFPGTHAPVSCSGGGSGQAFQPSQWEHLYCIGVLYFLEGGGTLFVLQLSIIINFFQNIFQIITSGPIFVTD